MLPTASSEARGPPESRCLLYSHQDFAPAVQSHPTVGDFVPPYCGSLSLLPVSGGQEQRPHRVKSFSENQEGPGQCSGILSSSPVSADTQLDSLSRSRAAQRRLKSPGTLLFTSPID